MFHLNPECVLYIHVLATKWMFDIQVRSFPISSIAISQLATEKCRNVLRKNVGKKDEFYTFDLMKIHVKNLLQN